MSSNYNTKPKKAATGLIVQSLYRMTCLYISLVITIWFMYNQLKWYRSFFFLTFWGILLSLFYYAISWVYPVFRAIKTDTSDYLILPKGVNNLGDLTMTLQLIIVPMYWFAVYPYEKRYSGPLNFWAHSTFAVTNFIDVAVFRKRYVTASPANFLKFGVVYLALLVSVTFATSKNLYPKLSFKNAYSYIMVAGCLILGCVFQAGMYYFLKAINRSAFQPLPKELVQETKVLV